MFFLSYIFVYLPPTVCEDSEGYFIMKCNIIYYTITSISNILSVERSPNST